MIDTIEGGDVLVHAPYVFVGLSQRTNLQAVDSLQRQLGKDWQVISFQLSPHILHLDCVMAILNEDTIICCPELILSNREKLQDIFKEQILISDEQVFHMAANILTVNPENVLIEQRHKKLQVDLQKRGIKAHPISWSEIKKLGGLFRCCTCPLA